MFVLILQMGKLKLGEGEAQGPAAWLGTELSPARVEVRGLHCASRSRSLVLGPRRFPPAMCASGMQEFIPVAVWLREARRRPLLCPPPPLLFTSSWPRDWPEASSISEWRFRDGGEEKRQRSQVADLASWLSGNGRGREREREGERCLPAFYGPVALLACNSVPIFVSGSRRPDTYVLPQFERLELKVF